MPKINNLILVLSYLIQKKIFYLEAQVVGLSLTYTMSKEWFSIN